MLVPPPHPEPQQPQEQQQEEPLLEEQLDLTHSLEWAVWEQVVWEATQEEWVEWEVCQEEWEAIQEVWVEVWVVAWVAQVWAVWVAQVVK